MGTKTRVLVVDDQPEILSVLDAFLTRKGFEVTTTSKPKEAIDLLRRGPFPLVLADLAMKPISGTDLLRIAREIDPHIVFILITGHPSVDTAVAALKSGAEDYILKPFRYQELLATIHRGLERRRLRREVSRLEEIVGALSNAIEALDPYTRGHADRVSHYSLRIGRALGLSDDQITLLKRAAMLHDVGKLGIDKRILRKPGPLTADEVAEIRKHPDYGNAILADFTTLRSVRECVYEHHERYDGQGYPRGVGGEEIGVCGRILSLVEVFDALATQRSYKEAWPLTRVIRYVEDNAGKAFDPDMARRFAEILRREGEGLVIPSGPYREPA